MDVFVGEVNLTGKLNKKFSYFEFLNFNDLISDITHGTFPIHCKLPQPVVGIFL